MSPLLCEFGVPGERYSHYPGDTESSQETSKLTITSATQGEFVHPLENRLLTLRECARLQPFPYW